MANTFILPLSTPKASLELVGGKGLSLSKMINAGLPVPDGFHITTQAYRQFVADNGLQALIQSTLQDLAAGQLPELEKAALVINGAFTESEMPIDIKRAILLAYQSLEKAGQAVAVRSSATAEDLPDASFAGQQETFLNVSGEEALLHAVKGCWASLWSARAIAYRLKNKVDQQTVALAVVVQELIDAEAAGILFTVNPVNGKKDEVVINAAWGLGEAVVGGLVSPDTITADKASGQVKSYDTGEKTLITVRTAQGTREQALKGRKRKARVLTDAQIVSIVELARKVEDFYAAPQDIEWAWADGQFKLLQARPVTTKVQETFTADWTNLKPKFNYFRGSLAEHLPNAATPLFSTLGLSAFNASIVELADSMDMRLTEAQYKYIVLNGYIYMSYQLTPAFTWDMIKVSIKNFSLMMSKGTERWQAARKEFAGTIAQWEPRDIRTLTPSEILEGVYAILYAAGKYYTTIQSGTLPSATTSEMVFSRVYKSVKGPDDPEAGQMLLGLDSVALRAEKSLYDLAQWAGEHADLRAYLMKTSGEQAAKKLESERGPAGVPAQDWAEFSQRLQTHQKEFGGTTFELDFINPSPAEMPDLAIDTIKVILEGKGSDPYERQREADELRKRTMAGILSHFHLIPRRWIRKSFEWALRCAPAREDSLADMGMGHPQVRRLLGELGRRLVEQGAITAADEIYWLYEDEVRGLAADLEKARKLANFSDKVQQRKKRWQAQMKLKPPAILPLDSPFAKAIPWARQAASDHELKGVAASTGSVTGTARVLFGPEDFERMQPGDILVAVNTTPAWTPLFTMAAGVVTDIGGPLSHSSIVAREYGIPAVLATGVATRVIKDGQIITVDGDAGLVTLQG